MANLALTTPTSGCCVAVLKVPKRDIFLTELSILSVPIWIGNLRAEPKKTFVLSARLIFAILFLYR